MLPVLSRHCGFFIIILVALYLSLTTSACQHSAGAAPIDITGKAQPRSEVPSNIFTCWPDSSHQIRPCTQEDWIAQGQSFRLTEEFEVEAPLARRVRFWKKIYGAAESHQWLLHDRDHPEIIYEVLSFPGKKPLHGLSRAEKRHINQRRAYYRQLLSRLPKMSAVQLQNDPAARRIKIMFSHLTAGNKYQKARQSIRLQRGQKDYIERGLHMASPYWNAIEAEFSKAGVPVELARLAFVESSFNLKAYSKVGAAGVYQLMRFIAKKEMTVTSTIDERKDPIKSARVAARMLAQNYRMLGSWPLAVTAYNHGPYGMKRAIKKIGSDQLSDLIKAYSGRGFGFASKNFYACYLAMLSTLQQAAILFPPIADQGPLQFRKIQVKKSTRIRSFAKQQGVAAAELLALNPDLRRDFVKRNLRLPARYQIKIPLPQPDQRTAEQGDFLHRIQLSLPN